MHLTVDLWASRGLDDYELVRSTLVEASRAAGAVLLHVFMHQFSPEGITGVAVLAESHISVHTWPDRGIAAFDVFTCGSANPYEVLPVVESAFAPERLVVAEQKRCVETGGTGGP